MRILGLRARGHYHYVRRDVLSVVAAVLDGGLRSYRQLALDFGGSIDKELHGAGIGTAILCHFQRESGVTDRRDFTRDGLRVPGICKCGVCGKWVGPDRTRETNQERRGQRESSSESHGNTSI